MNEHTARAFDLVDQFARGACKSEAGRDRSISVRSVVK
jgi:hypothetical protein